MRLSECEIDLFYIPLRDYSGEQIADFLEFLSSEEQARSARFRRDRDRIAYIIRRAVIRLLLEQYVGVAAKKIAFTQGRNGKPELSLGSDRIHVNWTHRHDLAACAISTAPVGIDLEWLDEQIDLDGLLLSAMSVAERQAIDQLTTDLKRIAFYKCWTSKEAFVKASGAGMSLPFTGFTVCVDPDKPAKVLLDPAGVEPGFWHVFDIATPAPNTYRGAIATAHSDPQLRYQRYELEYLNRQLHAKIVQKNTLPESKAMDLTQGKPMVRATYVESAIEEARQ